MDAIIAIVVAFGGGIALGIAIANARHSGAGFGAELKRLATFWKRG